LNILNNLNPSEKALPEARNADGISQKAAGFLGESREAAGFQPLGSIPSDETLI